MRLSFMALPSRLAVEEMDEELDNYPGNTTWVVLQK